jgi:Protein of unknown function (DUF3048) N-terminal domain/Protein of unknown function (DUF3048) C-terminal domain
LRGTAAPRTRRLRTGRPCGTYVVRVHSHRHARTRAILGAAVGVAALALVACGGQKPAAAPATTSAAPTIAVTQTPAASDLSPFTGLPGATGAVIAFKIDNTSSALPHIGLPSADVVYIEEVEGGLTRIIAIYASNKPPVIAPVRSARETDAELLPMYGNIPLAFSGSVEAVHVLLARAGIVDVSQDKGGLGYYRLSSRYAPYNLAGRATILLTRSGTDVQPHNVGFTFGPLPAGGVAAKTVTAVFPSARIAFRYNPSTMRWTYSLNGRVDQVPGSPAAAASDVLIQYVSISRTGRTDKVGNPVPFTSTIGHGNGLILRNGRAYKVTWSRASVSAPTIWLYNGQPFPLLTGSPWVVLADKNRPVKLT